MQIKGETGSACLPRRELLSPTRPGRWPRESCHHGGTAPGPASGLRLDTPAAITATAVGRVSQEANTGAVAGPAPAGAHFGVDMPIINTGDGTGAGGNPGNSWLLYKLLLAVPTAASSASVAGCDGGTTAPTDVSSLHLVAWQPTSDADRAVCMTHITRFTWGCHATRCKLLSIHRSSGCPPSQPATQAELAAVGAAEEELVEEPTIAWVSSCAGPGSLDIMGVSTPKCAPAGAGEATAPVLASCETVPHGRSRGSRFATRKRVQERFPHGDRIPLASDQVWSAGAPPASASRRSRFHPPFARACKSLTAASNLAA